MTDTGTIRLCAACLKAGTGVEMRCGPLQPREECDWCGWAAVLRPAGRDKVRWDKLPMVGEDDEGVWWLTWPTERQGPFFSRGAAWNYWRRSEGGTRHCEDPECQLCGKPKRPARTEQMHHWEPLYQCCEQMPVPGYECICAEECICKCQGCVCEEGS